MRYIKTIVSTSSKDKLTRSIIIAIEQSHAARLCRWNALVKNSQGFDRKFCKVRAEYIRYPSTDTEVCLGSVYWSGCFCFTQSIWCFEDVVFVQGQTFRFTPGSNKVKPFVKYYRGRSLWRKDFVRRRGQTRYRYTFQQLWWKFFKQGKHIWL